MVDSYDALLIVSFGGPQRPDDVVPFLENVVRGKNVPHERILEVAKHYHLFGGVSPSGSALRALLMSVVDDLNAQAQKIKMLVYLGNRHWHPFLADTLRDMADDGVRRALALVTSPYGSYAGCRAYLEAIEQARSEVGSDAPAVDKLRLFYNHPGFIEAMADRASEAINQFDSSQQATARLVFTAHSLPVAMARASAYEDQLAEACHLVAERLGRDTWDLCYQSRGGPPSQPWLEPELGVSIVRWHEAGQFQGTSNRLNDGSGATGVSPVQGQRHGQDARGTHQIGCYSALVLVPIGFMLENMELAYDLDVEIAGLCEQLGIKMARAAAVGNHPRVVEMIRLLVEERLDPDKPRLALGAHGPSHDVCPADCCPQASGEQRRHGVPEDL